MEIIIKIYKHIKKFILIYTGIYILIFAGLCFILPLYDLRIRCWVNLASAIIIIAGIVVGVLQLIFKIKIKAIKYILTSIFCIIALIASIYINLFCGLIGIFAQEYFIKVDEKKYVAIESGFMENTYVKYFDYKNIFVSGSKIRMERSRYWFF